MRYDYKIFEFTFRCDCGTKFSLEGKEIPNCYCPLCGERVKLVSEKLLRIEHKEG